MKDQVCQHVDVFKRIRKYLCEDYYLLLPQARTLESWSAWRFHDPTTGEGFVQAFRVRSPEQTRSVILKGIDPKSRYQFSDPYSGETFEVHGAELTSGGLSLDLPPLSSRVLVYAVAGNAVLVDCRRW